MKKSIEQKKVSSTHLKSTQFLKQINQLEADTKGQELIDNIKLRTQANLIAIIGSRKAESLSLQD